MAQDKIKVPRLVAGVKMPRRLRKAGILTAIINHPLGRSIMADVLVAAAGAAATALKGHQPSKSPSRHAGEADAQAENQSTTTTSEIAKSAAGMLGNLALDVVERALPSRGAKKSKLKRKNKNRNRAYRRKDQDQPKHSH